MQESIASFRQLLHNLETAKQMPSVPELKILLCAQRTWQNAGLRPGLGVRGYLQHDARSARSGIPWPSEDGLEGVVLLKRLLKESEGQS